MYTKAMPAESINPTIDLTSLNLRPEEKVVSAQVVKSATTSKTLSALEALQQLADVDRPEAIGSNGPVIAARALPENKAVTELHLYEVLFGRDALITARFVFSQFPELTRATVKRLAELQGIEHNSAAEEEPGEIVHEVRQPDDPIAQQLTATYGWQWPYYGSIDATPLFVSALATYTKAHGKDFLNERYTGRDGETHTVHDALKAAVQWLKNRMDSNPEGLLESERLNRSGGTLNQGWKDSPDAYHHADGTLANTEQGVASIEVQVLLYDALLDASELYTDAEKTDLQNRAKALRQTLFHYFWIEDERGSYFALGTDRDATGKLRPLKVRTSNMGHVLTSRLLDENDPENTQRKNALVQTLFASDMLTAYGIRTLSANENRFRPTSYHNGTIWPWDTYHIAIGLRRHGFEKEAERLEQSVRSVLTTTKLFPEFVSGANDPAPLLPNHRIKVRDTTNGFTHFIEQPPQQIQAWTVGAAVALAAPKKG